MGRLRIVLAGRGRRGFAVTLMKYAVTTLVIQNWGQVFQDTVNGFGGIASAIVQNSVNEDLVGSWTQQLQTYYATQSTTGLTNGMEALWHVGSSLGTALINLLLMVVALVIWPISVEIFALLYCLWGAVLYCIGPLVLALMPSIGFSRITKNYIQNVFIWNMWGILQLWKSDLEVSSDNIATGDQYAKDYDAVATLMIDGELVQYGVEYERSTKAYARYQELRMIFADERRLSGILYFVSGIERFFTVVGALEGAHPGLLFCCADGFEQSKMEALSVKISSQPSRTLGQALGIRAPIFRLTP